MGGAGPRGRRSAGNVRSPQSRGRECAADPRSSTGGAPNFQGCEGCEGEPADLRERSSGARDGTRVRVRLVKPRASSPQYGQVPLGGRHVRYPLPGRVLLRCPQQDLDDSPGHAHQEREVQILDDAAFEKLLAKADCKPEYRQSLSLRRGGCSVTTAMWLRLRLRLPR